MDARVRPDFRRAVAYAAVAIACYGVGRGVGAVHSPSLHTRLIAYGFGAGFLLFGFAATRSAANEVTRVSEARAGAATATPLRVLCLLAGYLLVIFVSLDLFAVPIGHLLLGGAVTGIILGIAAQQALGNLFAGLILLFSRPYVPGERIRVKAGALGGELLGTVTSVGLIYTRLETGEGPLNIPNGALLAAAVGPVREPDPATEVLSLPPRG
jgi:small-conductance mechanosensitive channel